MSFFRRLFGGNKHQEAATTMPHGFTPPENMPAADTSIPIGTEPLTPLPLDTTPAAVVSPAPMQTRPLEPPKAYATAQPSKQIRWGIASDVGRVRNNNQDGSLTLVANAEVTGNPPAIGLFMVADGMGGHKDGEHASAVTVQTLAQFVMQNVVLPQLESRELSSDMKTIPEVLAEAMEAANVAVQTHVPNGGTTATAAVIRGDLAYIAHVGDTRAYLITDGNMELVTRDHSLVRRLQELGQLTDEEAEVHPQRNVLYRAIGQGDSLEVDAATRRLPPASRLLICSDGLWGVV
ncbi:MAG: protein phosphatase 2C domain-containing protein, partial [Acidobacteriales bacterium]|nr:protein phosphatase 2C domain-containing protein [Terriglobales bacterium]